MGTVVDEATGAPLAGTIRVYMPDGRVVATHDFKGGQFAVTVPAAAGVEVTSPGYGVERRLVFFASGADEQAKAIHTDASGRKAVELERAATYAAARQAAAAASVAIGLRRR